MSHNTKKKEKKILIASEGGSPNIPPFKAVKGKILVLRNSIQQSST
jgi:hypothetical protein